MNRGWVFFLPAVLLSSAGYGSEIHGTTQDHGLWRMSHYVIDGKDFTSTTFRFGDRMERTRGRSISSGYSEALDESEEERIDFLLLLESEDEAWRQRGDRRSERAEYLFRRHREVE